MKNRIPCIDVIGLDQCTGCFACQSACTIGAILITNDTDGFYKPVVNRHTCTECGVCQKRCPVIAVQYGLLPSLENWSEPQAFAAWSNNDTIRLGSSSGGLFSELAIRVIENGGVVAGCVWGENFTPEHVLAHSLTDLEQMRGSKYVPSRVGNIYDEVLTVLNESEKTILFSGTPCQVAAMDAALSTEQREKVLLVEFLCHGVPSLRVFHHYIKELFGGESVISYTFRDKSLGWSKFSIKAESAEGKHYHVPYRKDYFYRGFLDNFYLMESCYKCAFARFPRVGDLTMGDFWGCPEHLQDEQGVSVVLVNNEKGILALDALRNNGSLKLEAVSLVKAIEKNKRAINGELALPNKRRELLDEINKGKSFGDLASDIYPSRFVLIWRLFLSNENKIFFLSKLIFKGFRKLQRLFC